MFTILKFPFADFEVNIIFKKGLLNFLVSFHIKSDEDHVAIGHMADNKNSEKVALFISSE